MQYLVTAYMPKNGADGSAGKRTAGKGQMRLVLNDETELFLYASEAKQLSIQEGMELSEEQYQYLLHDVIGKRAAKRAMHLLQMQGRTEYQLREKLLQSGYPKEAMEDAVSYVKSFRYLDDEGYARNFIRCYQEKRSRLRIQNDLVKRGVPKALVERCMEEEFSSDESAKIRELLQKKHFSAETADQNELRRMYQFLIRRGFRHSDVMAQMYPKTNLSFRKM